jgi:hypothetical protein
MVGQTDSDTETLKSGSGERLLKEHFSNVTFQNRQKSSFGCPRAAKFAVAMRNLLYP